jgi:uncharacterized protein (DUF2235 family)
MPKNLVICCDGTGCKFGGANTNVLRLYAALEKSPQQMTYYHPGLGTMGSKFARTSLSRLWTKLLGLAFGYGLMEDITSAYIFLMKRYDDGDNLYLFGFSRGAYTVRALAAMLHMFGLIRTGNESLIPYAIELFRQRIRNQHLFQVADGFKDTFSRDCKPHFVGCWDTVSSVGWIYDPLNLPFTVHNPDIAVSRHAVSIDERRCAFRQNLWQAQPQQDSQQLWFAGCHSDVGGSFAENENGLPNITLHWMLQEAIHAGLRIDPSQSAVLANLKEDPCGPIHNSLTTPWLPLEILPRRFWDTQWVPPRYSWHIPLARRRYMAPDSILHSSVKDRMQKMNYRPSNLPPTQISTNKPSNQQSNDALSTSNNQPIRRAG